jgi:hypothetical protein
LTQLTPKAEELVQAAREALRPSDADRERVFQALLPQVGSGLAAEGLNTPSTAPAAAGGVTAKITAAIVLIGVAGGGLFLALRAEPPPARPAATAPVASTAVPPAPVAKVLESVPSAVPRAEAAEERAPVAPRPADSLAEEVEILSRASAALHAGRPAAALKALDEHGRKFPRGALVQERTSARIQALCALGRVKEAQAGLARLARTSPSSPHVARARKACGAAVTEKE